MLPWLLLGGLAIYLLAKNSSSSDSTVASGPPPLSRTDTLGVGWKQVDEYFDMNKVKWNIFQMEQMTGSYGGKAAAGTYAGQSFTAPSWAVLKVMIDAFAASMAAGKSAQSAADEAVALAKSLSSGSSMM